MRILLICLFVLMAHCTTAQELVIEGLLYEVNSTHPIPYASIIDITNNKAGTTSHEDGSFRLVLPEGADNRDIYISSLGYRDTTLRAGQLIRTDTLYLKPRKYELPDVVVSSKPLKPIEIGNYGADVAKKNGIAVGKYGGGAGFSWGVYIKVRKKEVGALLDTLSVFFGEKGFPEAPLLIRILEFEKEFKKLRMLPRNKFKDLLTEPLIHSAESSGWQSIDLSNYKVRVPDTGLYILFIPLDKGNKYRYEMTQGVRYGARIGTYLNKKDAKRIFPLLENGEYLSIINRANRLVPAVSVVILKEK